MKYEDFNEIFEDDLSGLRFGSERQLEVLGYTNKFGRKKYAVVCSKCSQDPELFGKAEYLMVKSQIERNQHPCGCAHAPKWNEKQYLIILKRIATQKGYSFLGFSENFHGHKTKLRLVCDKHGEWCSTNINHFCNGRGCPSCKGNTTSKFNTATKRYSDEEILNDLLNTGKFHPETKFWRDEMPNKKGHFILWKMYCPECQTEGRSGLLKEFRLGVRTCLCSNQRQDIAYINFIKDGEQVIAVKFGIAVNPAERIKRQQTKCAYLLTPYKIFTFDSPVFCRNAETECKREFECGILTKMEMSDGHSETTSPLNLDGIIKIFLKHGGVPHDACT